MPESENNSASQRDLGDFRRGMLVIFSGSVARSVARILLIVFVIRLYGLESFGYLGEVAALVELSAALASYGLSKTLLAYIEHAKTNGQSESQLISDALFLSIFLALIFALLIWLVWSLIFPAGSGVPSYAVMAIVLITVTEIVLTITRSHRIIRWDALVKAVIKPWGFLLFCVIGYLFLVERNLLSPVEALFAGYISSQILGLIVACVGLKQSHRGAGYETVMPRLGGTINLAQRSFSAAIVDAGSFSFRRLDIILLGLIVGPAATGIYYLIQQIATVVEKMRHLFEPMAAPVLAQSKSPLITGDHLRRLCLWIFSAQIGLSVIFLLFADPVLQTFHLPYAQFALVLAFVLVGEIAEGTSGLVELPLVFNRPGIASWNIIIASIAELAIVAIGAFHFGIAGAAAGFAIAMALLAFLRFQSAKRHLELSILGPSYAKPLMAAITMSAMAIWIGMFITADHPFKLIAAITSCAIVYWSLLSILGISMRIAKSS